MLNKEKTLVILTPAFPADESDSVWIPAVQSFVKKMKENFPSINISVLSFNYPQHTGTYTWQAVQVISFNGLYKRKLSRMMTWARVWKRLKRINSEQTIIGLLSFWCGECALLGKYFGRLYGIKHYCWISGMDAKKENKLVKWIRPRANELVAMSAFLVDEFYRNHAVKPACNIPPGIDTSGYSKYEGAKDIDILGAGSLIPAKQYDVFIHVVKQLSISLPGIKTVICGGGSEQDRLKNLIKELKLENNIMLLGERPHSEVLQCMQRARVFLHPSSYEGFGLVYLEALYAGAHTIGFTYPLDHPVSHWYKVNNPEEMAKTAIAILKNPHTEYTPVLLFSMNDSVKAIMKLFDPGL
jgi:glycosyltransferase involved in cell wall biosynthesis